MKRYIIIFVLFVTLTILPGCYTVVWSPEDDFPTSEKYQQEYYEDNNYYADPYYGDYGYYYQYPWWLSVTPPAYSSPEQTREVNRSENPTVERLRNRDGSRNPENGRIINNTPVTRSGNTSTGSSSSGSSTDNTSTRKSTDSSSNTSTRSSSGSSSDNSSRSRNNDGGRDNGGRK